MPKSQGAHGPIRAAVEVMLDGAPPTGATAKVRAELLRRISSDLDFGVDVREMPSVMREFRAALSEYTAGELTGDKIDSLIDAIRGDDAS